MNFTRPRQDLFSTILLILILLGVSALGTAQSRRMNPNQGDSEGISAGGNWLEFSVNDKMTGQSRVRFQLLANNYFHEDSGFRPRVVLFCEGGKLKLADFNPAVRLAPPNRPGFWGQPQLDVRVRIDDVNYHKGWNWVRGHFLSMDKGTARGLIQAQVFNIQLPTRSGMQIAEFSPSGLDLNRVRSACDLTPKKPSKD